MRIAVLLTGNIRTWEKSNLSDFIDVDVDYFISTVNKKYNYHPFISNKFGYNYLNDEIMTNIEIQKIFEDLNYKELLVSDDDIINDNNFSENMRNINSCFHQYNRIKYDIILKSIFDMKYFGKLNILLNNLHRNVIYEMGNDTIIISNRNNFFNIVEFIINEFYDQKDKESHLNPPHGMLNSSINYLNLNNINKKITEIIRL